MRIVEIMPARSPWDVVSVLGSVIVGVVIGGTATIIILLTSF